MAGRDEFVEKLKKQIDVWNKQIGELEEKARKVGSGLKEEYQPRINELKAKRDQLLRKIEGITAELKTASEEAWQDFRKGAEEALQHLKTGMEKVIERLK